MHDKCVLHTTEPLWNMWSKAYKSCQRHLPTIGKLRRETQSLDNDIQGIVLHGKMKRQTKSWSGHETGSYVHVPYKQYNLAISIHIFFYYILILWKMLYSNWYCINCSLRNKSQWHTRGWLRTPPQTLEWKINAMILHMNKAGLHLGCPE